MRILLITNMYPTARCEYSGVFVKREVDALLKLEGIDDLRVFFIDTVSRASRYVTQRDAVAAAVREYSPDVIHVHYGLTLIAVPTTAIPVVVTFHGSDLGIWWQRVISRNLARRAAALVVVSPQMVPALAGLKAPVSVIPCGVDTSVFEPRDRSAARAALGLPQIGTLVAFPSSAGPGVKNYPLFVDAISRLDGVEPVLLGGTSPGDMPLWLSAIDVVVYTSDREGSPVLSKEALCCGTRVVAVPAGDLATQVDGLAGCRIVQSRRPADLAAAIAEVLTEPGPDARIAAERFSATAEARAVLDVYRGLVS